MMRWAMMLLVLFLSAEIQAEDDPPRVFVIDPDVLVENRQRVAAGDPALGPAVRQLIAEADDRLDDGPFSVVNKTAIPPSGDKHDYQSIGPYWWPDPETPDGLPYVRRDGRVNPERETNGDRRRFGRMRDAVVTLARAWYFTGNERYASRAAELLRVWYLDPATRMNPNLNYAQGIPGRVEGRCFGIVDAAGQPHVIDAIGMLQSSDAWTDADQRAMVQWFEQFLDWLLTSEHGTTEDTRQNNHATQYDVQVTVYAMFVGQMDVAERVLRAVGPRRIDTHIKPDGSQPHELTRTKSWHYSCYNASHLSRLVTLGERAGIDLWGYDAQGVSIKRAIDFLLPYIDAPQDWAHEQIVPVDASKLLNPLLNTAGREGAEAYTPLIRELLDADDVRRLLYRVP